MRAIDGASAALTARIDAFNRVAGRVARDGAGDGYVKNAVEMMTIQHDIKAQIQVIRASREMVDSLLHVIA